MDKGSFEKAGIMLLYLKLTNVVIDLFLTHNGTVFNPNIGVVGAIKLV